MEEDIPKLGMSSFFYFSVKNPFRFIYPLHPIKTNDKTIQNTTFNTKVFSSAFFKKRRKEEARKKAPFCA